MLSHGPNTTPTVGVYDENVIAPNTVDFIAPGSNITNTQFAANVAAAYAENLGGVINGSVLGAYHAYGVDHPKTITLMPNSGTNFGAGSPSGGRAISGTGAFATTSTTTSNYNFVSFSLNPSDNHLPGEEVVQLGVTALSLTNRDYGDVTVTARLASGATMSASRAINEANGQGDTFYGFVAPTGDYFTGFSMEYSGPVASPDFRLWFDDIGFVTAVVGDVPNSAPVAVDDVLVTDEDTPLSIQPADILANDTDADGDDLTAVIVTRPARGTLVPGENGSWTYTPDADYNGPDSFTYTANDGQADSQVATVFIRVRAINDAPVASADSYSLDEDSTLTVSAPGVLGNDTDTEGQSLSAVLVDDVAHGVLSLSADGSFNYTPNENYNGADSFTYRAVDTQSGESTLTTVSLTINSVNDAPVLADATLSVAENSPAGTIVDTVAGSDDDGDSLAYSIVGGNQGDAFAIDAQSGAISVADASQLDYETTSQFLLNVQVSDGELSTTATITIDLTDLPEGVVAPQIDIRPSDRDNDINIKSRGKIEVAILSSESFDAQQVDVGSLTFGRTGDEDSLSRHPRQGTRYRLADVNGDGRLDLLVQFETQQTGFRTGDTQGVLKGRLQDGTTFESSDSVNVKRPGKGPDPFWYALDEVFSQAGRDRKGRGF